MLSINRVHEIRQQIWPADFEQILLRTNTRLVFCYRKLMKTDIFFTRITKPCIKLKYLFIYVSKDYVLKPTS
jgi:hypothetical protein